MLIKLGSKFKNTWVNPDCVKAIGIYGAMDCCRIEVNVSVDMPNEPVAFCSVDFHIYEEAVKATDELANKINAAQGCKLAAREKTTMKYEEHGDEPSIIGVYRCSHCKTVIREEHSWYKFCPACGREIKRWE